MVNRWFSLSAKFCSWAFAAAILTACGGGGGSDSSSGGGFLGPEPDPIYALTLETFNAAGEPSTSLSRSNPLTVVATLTRDGDAASGESVTLSTTIGTVAPDNGSVLTEADGSAVFTLTYSGVEGTGQINASYSDGTASTSATKSLESVNEGSPFILELATSSPAGAITRTFSQDAPLTVTVTLSEVSGELLIPAGDRLISLTTTIGNISPNNGSTLTDSAGVATFTLNADAALGAGVIVTKFDDGIDILAYQQTVEAVTTSNDYALTIANVSNGGVVTPSEPVVITLQLTSTDTVESPIGNQIINLNTDLGTVDPANGSARTDSSGTAVFSIAYNNIVGAGTVTATYDAPDSPLAVSTAIAASSPTASRSLIITTTDAAGAATNQFGANTPLTVNVAIVNAAGSVEDIDNELITLNSTIGELNPANGQALTIDGVASFELSFNGDVGGGQLTAEWNADTTTVQLQRNIQAIVDNPYTVSLTKSAGDLTINNPVTLTATVLDGNGDPVIDEIVELTSTLGTLSTDSGLTNNAGEAVFTLSYNGAGAGTATATATSVEGSFQNTVNINAVNEPPPYVISIESITNPNGIATDSFSDIAPLTVLIKLTDADGVTAVAGEVVNLDTSIGTISDPALGSRTTDSNGEAVFTVTNDQGLSGAGTITASYDSNVGAVSARRNVQAAIADDVYTIEITAVTNNGIIANGNPVTITVQLSSTDSNYPISNQIIDASTTVGVIQSSSGLRTDANGIATFEVAAGTFVEAGTVTVNYFDAPNGSVSDTTNLAVEVSTIGFNLQIDTRTPTGDVSNQFSAITPLIVTVSIVDDTGAVQDIDGEPISLTTLNGIITPQSGATPNTGSALTIDGTAEFVLAFDGTYGATVITAQYEAELPYYLRASKDVEAIAENPYVVTVTTSAGDLTINNPLTLTATVLDGNGDPVINEVVQLTSTLGTLSTDSGLTNNAGEAVFTLSYNGAGAGTATATATSVEGSFQNTVNINAVNEPPPYVISITAMTDEAGNATSEYSFNEPLTVVATLTDGTNPLVNRVVSLDLDGIAGVITPQNGSTLTDDDGKATFTLSYNDQTGAGTVAATFAGPLATVSDSANVEAVVEALLLGSLDDTATFIDGAIRALPSNDVSYLGSVELLFAVANSAGELVSTVENIRIESACLLNGFASLDSGLDAQTIDGRLSVTYTADAACEDRDDTLTATLVQPGISTPQTASVTLTIGAAPAANERFITFIDATPLNIALKGTGGGTTLSESSLVTFEVRDGSGNPVAGETVDFELSTTVGGIDLVDTVATTNANGQVNATLLAGVIATSVRVIATIERSPADMTDNPISVVSDVLSISSGIAAQARFSIAAEVLNPPNAAIVDGVEVAISISAFDRFGNPVPDGTAITFTAECGGIGTAGPTGACQTITGRCSTSWTSQPGAARTCPANRVTILAHATGEEAFTDQDGDGYYTTSPNEPFVDNTEAYRDDDESGNYDLGEFFIDSDTNGVWNDQTPSDTATGIFNGLACQVDSTDCSTQLVSVFDSVVLVAGPSDSSDLFGTLFTAAGTPLSPIGTLAPDSLTAGSYVIALADIDLNVPPLGTVISAEGNGECEVTSDSYTVPNLSAPFPILAGITIRSEPDDPSTDDYVEITWSIPDGTGNVTQITFDCIP